MIASYPESDRSRGVVYEHAPNVRLPWEKIVGELTGSGIHSCHAVGPHRANPYVAVFIRHHVVGSAPRRGQHPFQNFSCLWIEHTDAIRAILGKPKPVLAIES